MKRKAIYIVLAITFLFAFLGCKKKSTTKDIVKTSEVITTKKNTTQSKTKKEDEFSVSFDLNGGTGNISSQTIKKGEKITQPDNPTRLGYTFNGWFYKGEKWAFIGYVVTEEMVLVANWTPNDNSLVLTKNITEAGNVTGAGIFKTDEEVTIKAETNDGYTFGGWFNGDNKLSNKENYSFKMSYNDLSLEARWKVNTYTLTLNVNSEEGTVEGAGVYEYNSSVTVKATSKIENYIFDGWYNGSTKVNSDLTYTFTIPYNDLALEARFIDYLIYDDSDSSKVIGLKYKDLTSIVIPNNITSIGAGAFSGCSKLESITLPFVGDKAHTSTDTDFYPFGYIFGTESYEGGTKIYTHYNSAGYEIASAYYIPTTLKEVIITGGSYIQGGSFHNCSNLTSITIPNSVTGMGSGAFYSCSGLTSITIPNGVTSINSSVFGDCYNLKSINIPDSVESIGDYAFYYCSNLTSITIPKSVAIIGKYVFDYCSNLTKVYYKGTSSEWATITIDSLGNDYLTNATRYYFTNNGANEITKGNWWYYDTDGTTIIEIVVE